MNTRPVKTIVILGPTASGKSDLAIALAKKCDGEVISVDSRQVYRGMDIGSGKVLRDQSAPCHINNGRRLCDTNERAEKQISQRMSPYLSEGIRHHLLDVASPKRAYNVTHFVRDAKKAIRDIRRRGKRPILCGGTGFWAQALIEESSFPPVKPDPKLRARLGKLSAPELFERLKVQDPRRAKTVDPHNRIRLIRALEIIAALGKVPVLIASSKLQTPDSLIIAFNSSPEILRARMEKRLKIRLKQGMIEEVKRLRESGLSWKRLESFGLEYRSCARFLQGKVSREEMETGILTDSLRYAKRQLTFLRRMEKSGIDIHWISNPEEAKTLFLKK